MAVHGSPPMYTASDAVDVGQHDLDGLVLRRWEILPDVVGPDGQLPVPSIDQAPQAAPTAADRVR